MHFNKKRHNSASFSDGSEFDESTDPGLDRMATQYIVDPNAPPPAGGYPPPYANVPKTSSAPQTGPGFTGSMPQMTPPLNSPTGGFQPIPSGFIPSHQVTGEFSSPGFQQPRASGSFQQPQPTGSFEQLSSAGMMSPGFQQPRASGSFQQPQPTGSFEQLSSAGMMSPGFQQPRASGSFQQPTGSFEQLSSAGMMSPGFQQPRASGSFQQPQITGNFQLPNSTGSFEKISSAGMMSPGFQNLQPPATNGHLTPKPDSKILMRYALATGTLGAVVGLLLGILNTLMQGWKINQGTPQTLILVGLFTVAFGLIAYFRHERVDELLAQANLGDVSEFLGGAKPNQPRAIVPSNVAQTGSFQPPADAIYRNSPSGTFRTPDPDSTDEIHIR